MLENLHSSFYNYLRGAIFILTLYQLLFYVQTKKRKFLYYSLYFFMLSIYFIRYEIPIKYYRNLLGFLSPTIHTLSFYFYISFTREVLNTKKRIPKWDVIMKRFRIVLLIMSVFYLLVLFFLGFNIKGFNVEVIIFNIFSLGLSLFSLITFFYIYKMKTKESKMFFIGSVTYFIFANATLLIEIFYGVDNFKDSFHIHLIFLTYFGVLFEAIAFALLLGFETKKIESEKTEVIKKLDELKQIVVKNYITLKDKTKVYVADLLYIKSDGHYLKVYLSNGKNHFFRGTLNQIIQELPPNFIRCHRSYIVNRNFIKQINNDNIILVDSTEIPLSRTYKNRL